MEKTREEHLREQIRRCSHKFSNGKILVNTCPHDITFVDGDEVVNIPFSKELLVNATTTEIRLGEDLVETNPEGNPEGEELIALIQDEIDDPKLRIIGSVMAADAYANVVGMTPMPGFERVPPAEKRMSIEKFNSGHRHPDWA